MLPLHLFHCCKNWKTFLFFVWVFFFVWFGCCTKRTELLALNEVKLKGMESGQQAGKEKHKHLEKKIASNMNDCSDNFSPPNPDRCLRLHSFWLWNMNADYLACLAMKLLCFVFSSRGGEGSAEGLGEGGSLCACWGHRDTIVWRALRGNREGELGRWEGERERENLKAWMILQISQSWTDGNINREDCLMNFWWVFYELKGYYLKMNNARKVQQTTLFTGTDSGEPVSLPSSAQVMLKNGHKTPNVTIAVGCPVGSFFSEKSNTRVWGLQT